MTSVPSAGDLPAHTAEILAEVTGIAAAPGTLAERAEAVLAQVQRVVRFDAAWITLLLPGRSALVALGRSGYDERVSGFLDSPGMLEEVERVGMDRPRLPVRLRDSPIPPTELPSWAEYLEPAGFRDGVSAGLFASGRGFLGLVTMHTRTADQMSDAVRDAVALLAAPIAAAVDPLRSLATIAGMVERAVAGSVLTPSGPVPLPGLPDHRLLASGSGVLTAAAAQLAQGGPHASFLAPLASADGADGAEAWGAESHVRITVLAVPPDVQAFATSVVLISPAGDLYGLSPRELQVLGLLVTGASNQRIGVALGITARTVAVHLDHVRTKLAAGSRTAAAARALRLGLFVPASLGVRR